MKSVVIGGNGFVGAHLCRQLAKRSHRVASWDIDPKAGPGGGVECKRIDVTSDEILFDEDVDAVFYLSQSPRYRDFPDGIVDLLQVNSYAPVRICRALTETNVKLFVYASSGSVYRPSFDTLDESSPTERDTPYALSKLIAEDSIALFDGRFPCSILRIFSPFGRDQTAMLPSVIFNRVVNESPIVLFPGPGEGNDTEGLLISFFYVVDLAAALVALAERAVAGEAVPKVLNAAGPEVVSLKAFAAGIGRVLGKKPVFQIGETERGFDLKADASLLHEAAPIEHTPLLRALQASYGPR